MDIPLNKHRPADFVLSKHVEITSDEIKHAQPEKAKVAEAEPVA